MEEDDFLRPRMGRLDEAEGHRIEGLLRFRRRRKSGVLPHGQKRRSFERSGSKLLSDHALDTRVRQLTLSDGQKGREVVVKSADGPPKTIAAVRALVRYVARLDASGNRKPNQPPVHVFDGYGREITPATLLTELETWNLFSNHDNRSKKAREAAAQGDRQAIREMSSRERYRNVQAWHFIWSIHAGDDPDLNAERLRAAALVTVERQFTERGHRVLWGIHRDKDNDGRLHAHVVVEALSRNGDRIRCDKYGDYLYSMRVELASNLRATGLDYIATLREDRYSLRQEILAGKEPLRKNLTLAQIKSGGGELSQCVPEWWGCFGEEVLENWARAGKPRSRLVEMIGATRLGKNMRTRDLVKERDRVRAPYQPIFDQLVDVFQDPHDALGLWHLMAQEGSRLRGDGTADHPNRRLAIWYLVNRPETFGSLCLEGPSLKTNRMLKWLLQRVELPVSNDRRDHQAISGDSMKQVDVLNFSRIKRDRSKVKVSLLRVAQIAEDRGMSEKIIDEIRWRIRSDLKHVKIGSPVYRPNRRLRTDVCTPPGSGQKAPLASTQNRPKNSIESQLINKRRAKSVGQSPGRGR